MVELTASERTSGPFYAGLRSGHVGAGNAEGLGTWGCDMDSGSEYVRVMP